MNFDVNAMLGVAQALARSKEADDALKDALKKLDGTINEQNTALAEILEAMEKAAKDNKGIDHEALGKAIAAALVVGIKNLPQPTLKVEMPATPERKDWTSLSVKTPKGETYTVTRK